MKKLFCLIMVLCLIPIVALSDADLSSMSYEELLKLRSKIELEIMSRPEWKEVEVPAGEWRVGVDIPAGVYSFSVADEYCCSFKVYTDSSKKRYDFIVLSENSSYGRYVLEEGMILDITRHVIFAPAKGLGF